MSFWDLEHIISYKLLIKHFKILQTFKKMRPIKFLRWEEGGRKNKAQRLEEGVNCRKQLEFHWVPMLKVCPLLL